MKKIDWQIGRDGRAWSEAEEHERMWHVVPLRAVSTNGKLFSSDEERLSVIACLLENVGIDKVVRSLGNLDLWDEAIKATGLRDEQKDAAAGLKDLANRAARSLANFDKQLDSFFEELERLDPDIARRAVARTESRFFASLLLFCPGDELGGKSMLQLWAEGNTDAVRALLRPIRNMDNQ